MCCPYGWVLGQNSLNKGPFFGRFFMNMGELARNWRKIAKNGSFSAKVHHKSGYDRNSRQLEEGNFLRTGRQTPILPQVIYPLGIDPNSSETKLKQQNSVGLQTRVETEQGRKRNRERPNIYLIA